MSSLYLPLQGASVVVGPTRLRPANGNVSTLEKVLARLFGFVVSDAGAASGRSPTGYARSSILCFESASLH